MKQPRVQLKDVRFCYGEVCAVERLNMTLSGGSLTALIGPNGGGKSTIIKMIAGLLKPEAGSVITTGSVGYVAQEKEFDESFPASVFEMVLMGTLRPGAPPFKSYSKADRQAAKDAIARVGIEDVARRGVGQLSGGQQKRAMIARALASGCDVIVLDEPDAGLDIDASNELYEVLNSLKSDHTILAASHHIDSILGIADSAVYVARSAKEFAPDILREKLKEGLLI